MIKFKSSFNRIKLHKNANVLFSTPDGQSYFFGYYNYSPISRDGKKMLAHRAYFEGRKPSANDIVDIGYFDLDSKVWNKIAESRAFNWQQGSMLQWLGPDFNTRFIFNDVKENRYISRIIDLNNQSEKNPPYAIYGVDPAGQFSISLNFERCYWTRAYNYESVVSKKWDKNIPEGDGIFRIELETGKAEKIISLEDIVRISEGSKENAHWLEHIMLNPSGTRFAFYHRFGTKLSYETRVFTADVDGGNIWAQPHKEGNRYSHLGWRDDKTYTIYTATENKTIKTWKSFENQNNKTRLFVRLYRKVIKPFIPRLISRKVIKSGSHYAMVKDHVGLAGMIEPKMLPRDGHPSFTKDARYMLTDTYEDEKKFRHLYLYDFHANKLACLGKFYSTYNSCGWRADLHPRFSPDEKFVIIDSTHNGIHQMSIIDIKNVFK